MEGWFGDVVRVMAETAAAPGFEEVRQLYGAAVHRFCLVALGDAAGAEAAANRALQAAEAAYPVDHPEAANVPVWLLGIACEDVRRRRRPVRRQAASATTELDAALAAAGALPEQELLAAALRGAAGLGYAEIGGVLGTSPEAARMACGWAMRRIRTGAGRIG